MVLVRSCRGLFFVAGVLLFTAILGCGEREAPIGRTFSGKHPMRVVCTTGMVADLVEKIAGDQAQVTSLMGEGVDPHQYKPTPADIAKLRTAHIVFFNGLHLEGKMSEVLDQLHRQLPSINIGARLASDKLLRDEDGHADPHIWFDVLLWLDAGSVVADALAEFDPRHADEYRNRFHDYQKTLIALHEDAKSQLSSIPKAQRVLVTSHDAFRYLGRAYDVEVQGVQGISTESEASVRDIQKLVDFITRRQVKAVFVESSVNPRNMRALIEGCRERGHKVAQGGELFSDAMGKAGTPEGTYLGMIRHNVATIAQALR